VNKSRHDIPRCFGTKEASIPIERYAAKSLTPRAPTIAPELVWREDKTSARSYCGSLHVHGKTRLGQIAALRGY
jgi:hypothetical protein